MYIYTPISRLIDEIRMRKITSNLNIKRDGLFYVKNTNNFYPLIHQHHFSSSYLEIPQPYLSMNAHVISVYNFSADLHDNWLYYCSGTIEERGIERGRENNLLPFLPVSASLSILPSVHRQSTWSVTVSWARAFYIFAFGKFTYSSQGWVWKLNFPLFYTRFLLDDRKTTRRD